VRQSIFTFIAKVNPQREAELTAYLAQIRKNVPRDPDMPFALLPMLHFTSLVLFPDDTYGTYLVFENNVDGTPQAYLDALLDAAAPALHRIYGMCLEYDGAAVYDRTTLRSFLLARLTLPHAGYIGNVGRSVQRTKAEAELRRGLETQLDTLVNGQEAAAAPDYYGALRDFARGSFGWALKAERRIGRLDLLMRWAVLAALAFALFVLWPVAGPLLLLFVIVLRMHEITDKVDIPPSDPAHVLALAANEDNIVQNHMASLCYVKNGRFRLFSIRLVLFLTKLVGRVSIYGKLSGLNSLHFAHWAVIDDGRRLLFMTNYDGRCVAATRLCVCRSPAACGRRRVIARGARLHRQGRDRFDGDLEQHAELPAHAPSRARRRTRRAQVQGDRAADASAQQRVVQRVPEPDGADHRQQQRHPRRPRDSAERRRGRSLAAAALIRGRHRG